MSIQHGRQFPVLHVRIADEGRRQHACRIVCSSCHAEEFVRTSGGTPPSGEFVRMTMKRKGWYVGRNPNRDLCPKCLSHHDLIERSTPAMPDLKTVPPSPSILKPEPPKPMSRDDRRVIFAKLEDVYESPSTGYRVGWTDKRVAEDLGVPRKWVEDVRAEFFGDVKDNPELVAIREAAIDLSRRGASLANDITEAHKLIEGLRKEYAGIEADLQLLNRRVAEISKQVLP